MKHGNDFVASLRSQTPSPIRLEYELVRNVRDFCLFRRDDGEVKVRTEVVTIWRSDILVHLN